jgi:hypothetical protein
LRYAVIGLLLAGCVISQEAWVKDGSSSQDLESDQRQCNAQAFATPGGGAQQISTAFNQCMRSRGWRH